MREQSVNRGQVAAPTNDAEPWQFFVLNHGLGSRARDLAHVLGRSEADIERARQLGPASGTAAGASRYGFGELFSLWHGRQPHDDEWPAPTFHDKRGSYEWQVPEVAFLATLVGELGPQQLADLLTERLRGITGDPTCCRDRVAVMNQIARLGLQTSDVVGGITAAQAGRELGSAQIMHQAIRNGDLVPRRVGRYVVISHQAWADFKAKVQAPPPGFVQLSTLKGRLGIASDKLSEFARMGYVPEAVRVNTFGTHSVHTTKFGTWFVPEAVATRLLEDRHAGRAMPWHGKPTMDNLRTTWRLFEQRRHPASCQTCHGIWGAPGAPSTFEDYVAQYPGLAHGAKRHLTMPWNPGLTAAEVAMQAKCSVASVRRAIESGALAATKHGRTAYVTRTDATRWIARKCPSGEGERSWISLETAARVYSISEAEALQRIASGEFNSKVGQAGAARGIVYLQRQQCAQFREREGYTAQQAAARAGVSVERLKELLKGVKWRNADTDLIPLATLQAVIKRIHSRQGHTVSEAADLLGVPEAWVRDRIDQGVVKIKSASWDDRLYVTQSMLTRLRSALAQPEKRSPSGAAWVRLSRAASIAGVSASTLMRWGDSSLVQRQPAASGMHYLEADVRSQAREYWKTARWVRDRRPAWLVAEEASLEAVG